MITWRLLSSGKVSTCQCRKCKGHKFNPWVGKIPWRRKWQPIPVILPGKFHGQRSLVGCSPWGHRVAHNRARVRASACTHTHTCTQAVSSVQSLSCVRLFVTPWTAVCQASLSFTSSRSLLKLISIELVMPSNHLILCHPLLLLPSIFPSIRVFSNESVLHVM